MVAAMAVEIFVWVYIFAFLGSAVLAIALLVTAARRLAKSDRKNDDRMSL